MTRVVSPPLDRMGGPSSTLTSGERRVLQFFLEHTATAWEIYVQPHLNGLRPDIVLLHPRVGVAVFEVKDWSLVNFEVVTGSKRGDGPTVRKRMPWGTREGVRNPILQLRQYAEEISELYCPRLGATAGQALIATGIIFMSADTHHAREFCKPLLRRRSAGRRRVPEMVCGADFLTQRNVEALLPRNHTASGAMSPGLAMDLRSWLVEPSFAAAKRKPPEVDIVQRSYIKSRTPTGFRRIRGPAGSGKSLVLAGRAAQLAAEGKDVLVVTFNMTLVNYLRDMADRVAPMNRVRQKVTWLHFHGWCKRVCIAAERTDEYQAIWRTAGVREFPDDQDERLVALVSEIIDADDRGRVTRYDAILVDEGQDFLPPWWSALRKVRKEGGEMLLVADTTQDIYRRASAWTDEVMSGAGFSGPWVQLETSYRMPIGLIQHAREFAERYLPLETRHLPAGRQLELEVEPCDLRWVQTDPSSAADDAVAEVFSMLMRSNGQLAAVDITILVPSLALGNDIVTRLNKLRVNVQHTFRGGAAGKRRKMSFHVSSARIKATTLHSFKGWESRALVICTGEMKHDDSYALLYSGITRLKRDSAGSWLTVVASTPRLESYGRTWPTYRTSIGKAFPGLSLVDNSSLNQRILVAPSSV